MAPRSPLPQCPLTSVSGAGLAARLPPSFPRRRLRPGISHSQELTLATVLAYLGLALHQHDAGDDRGLEAPRGLHQLCCAQRPRGSGGGLQQGSKEGSDESAC